MNQQKIRHKEADISFYIPNLIKQVKHAMHLCGKEEEEEEERNLIQDLRLNFQCSKTAMEIAATKSRVSVILVCMLLKNRKTRKECPFIFFVRCLFGKQHVKHNTDNEEEPEYAREYVCCRNILISREKRNDKHHQG
jgi:predicted DNA binding CopG/RHH family protein